tara:strand:- start:9 stop:263 length:255 start_codon:yes stop_codon:yes gene_type:complete
MLSHNILIDKNNENTIIDRFNNRIGKATIFKYQCPRIIEKNTAAVIMEFSSVTISAPVGFIDGTILGIILAIIMQPITLIAEII